MHSAMETYDYLISLISANVESVLARFNDYRTSIRTILAETYSTNPTATEEQCFAIVESDALTAKTTYDNYREVYDRIENELDNVEIDIPNDEINAYKDAVINYAQKVANIFDVVNARFINDLNDLLNWVTQIKEYLMAYRMKYTTSDIEE